MMTPPHTSTVAPLTAGDPSHIGPLRLLGRLGQGGMGIVYLALTADERAVALKALRPDLVASDSRARRRFARELDALAAVSGPHLVELLDADLNADPPYLLTRYVPGRRLDHLVTETGPLSGHELYQLCHGTATGLHTLHTAGIAHRDLNPGNILLADGQPHIIDLGLAVLHTSDSDIRTAAHTRAVDTGAFEPGTVAYGTPGYLTPEHVAGRQLRPASDIYAWGLTMLFAATGTRPRRHGTSFDLHDVPIPLDRLIQAATAEDPQQRPDAQQLLDALVDLHPDRAPAGHRSPDRRPDHRPDRRPDRGPDGRAARTAVLPADAASPDTSVLDDSVTVALTPPQPALPVSPPATRRLEPDGVPATRQLDQHPPSPQTPTGPARQSGRAVARTTAALTALTALAALTTLASAALLAPVLTAVLVLVGTTALRVAGRASAFTRRSTSRSRTLSIALSGAALPVHVVLATIGTVLMLPIVTLLAALTGAAVWYLNPQLAGITRDELSIAVATAAAAAFILARRGHRHSRALLARAVPGPHRRASTLLMLAALTASTVGCVTLAQVSDVSAWPLPTAAPGSSLIDTIIAAAELAVQHSTRSSWHDMLGAYLR